jgi:hypothetical protein
MMLYVGVYIMVWVLPIQRGFVPGFVNYKKKSTRLAATTDKVYQMLAHGRWFFPGTPASSTIKTGRHDIAEILLKVALSTINQIKSILIINLLSVKCIHSMQVIIISIEHCTDNATSLHTCATAIYKVKPPAIENATLDVGKKQGPLPPSHLCNTSHYASFLLEFSILYRAHHFIHNRDLGP